MKPARADEIPGLDPGIARFVAVLAGNGIETYESCQGGPGHAFAEPTVRFHGGQAEGFRAFAVAANHGLPVLEIRRFWSIVDGEPTGPHWEMTFRALSDGSPSHHMLQVPGFIDHSVYCSAHRAEGSRSLPSCTAARCCFLASPH